MNRAQTTLQATPRRRRRHGATQLVVLVAVACFAVGFAVAGCSSHPASPQVATTEPAKTFPLSDLVPNFYARNYSFEGAKGLRLEPFSVDAASYGVVTIDGGPVTGRGGLLVYKLKPDAGDPARAFLQSGPFTYRGPLDLGNGMTAQVAQDNRTQQPIVCFTQAGFLYCATAASSVDTSAIVGALTGSS